MKLNLAHGLTILLVLFLVDKSLQQESFLEKIVDTNFKNSFCKFLSLNVQNQDKSKIFLMTLLKISFNKNIFFRM